MRCIGEPLRRKCRCYDATPEEADTPEKAIAQYYAENLISRNYSAFASFLAQDATVHVPFFGTTWSLSFPPLPSFPLSPCFSPPDLLIPHPSVGPKASWCTGTSS